MYCFPHKIFGNEIRTVHTYQQKYSPRKTFQQLRTTKKSIYDLDLHNNNNTILTAWYYLLFYWYDGKFITTKLNLKYFLSKNTWINLIWKRRTLPASLTWLLFHFLPGTNLWYSRRGTPNIHTQARTLSHWNFYTRMDFKSASTSIRKEIRTSAYTKSFLECLQCLMPIAIISNKTQAKSQYELIYFSLEEKNQSKQNRTCSYIHWKFYLIMNIYIYIYIICGDIHYKIVYNPCSSSPQPATSTDIRKEVLLLFIYITVPIFLLQSVILSTLASTPHEAGTGVRRCGTLRNCCLTAPGSSSGGHQDWSRGRHRRPRAAASHR